MKSIILSPRLWRGERCHQLIWSTTEFAKVFEKYFRLKLKLNILVMPQNC
ncbi:MAG: hypothetical protein LBR79_03020 [Oscillospiraceae bacterium]|nr:hypothetical protein [Oscillospiraceae bacterium]